MASTTAFARGRALSRLHTRAAAAGLRASRSQLARAAFKLRHVPGAIAALRANLRLAAKDGDARKALDRYIALRADPGSALRQVLGGALGKDGTVRFVVGGKYGTSRRKFEVNDNTTGTPLLSVYQSSKNDVTRAIGLAQGALSQTAALTPAARAKILGQIAKGIANKRAALGELIALEAGKPIADALTEVDRAVNTFKLAAKEARALEPRIEKSGNTTVKVTREPVGVISAIAPFNFPLNLVAHKVAPAIAAGAPVLIKPSPRTPLTAVALAEIIRGTDWPKAAMSLLTPATSSIKPLITDKRIRMVSFTGSDVIGWKIKKQAFDKRVALELGGNAALIVHSDADVADAAKKAVRGAFAYQGQVCISTQRIYVQRSKYKAFVSAFVREAKKLDTGDPLLAKTGLGPMIDAASAKRVRAWVKEAVAGGAKLLLGNPNANGRFVKPLVLTNTKASDKVNAREVFAPVVTITPYDKVDHALKAVNDSPFGLQAGILTKDNKIVDKAYRTLQVGGLVVGHVPTMRVDSQPYGGVKNSGFGREGPRYALDEMTEFKAQLVVGGAKKGGK